LICSVVILRHFQCPRLALDLFAYKARIAKKSYLPGTVINGAEALDPPAVDDCPDAKAK
jgi:hypothetical protein